MATVSKDSKKINSLKEEFERRDLNVHSIKRVIENSLDGISSYAKDGKSFIIYVFCSLIEIIAGFIFNVNGLEWILIISMLGIILAIELLNTAVEATCDAITKEFNPYIKVAKDCGSAATFVIFIVTVILNIIIFLPKIAF
jgi:diacylglycerol kinase